MQFLYLSLTGLVRVQESNQIPQTLPKEGSQSSLQADTPRGLGALLWGQYDLPLLGAIW